MNEVQALPPDTMGTVLGVDDIGSVLMQWDTGSSLNLIPEEDKYDVVGRKCPCCGRDYTESPAISRRDNKTKICPLCGMREALEDFLR